MCHSEYRCLDMRRNNFVADGVEMVGHSEALLASCALDSVLYLMLVTVSGGLNGVREKLRLSHVV